MSASVDFPSSTGKLIFEQSSFEADNKAHEKVVEKQNFNYSVSLILPAIEKPNVNWIKKLVETESYQIKNVPASLLVEEEFLGGFVRNGSLHLMSNKTHIDTDNCLALLPSGVMVLNLTKDTYESLGLEGKPSQYCLRKKTMRYVVQIDLKAASFVPGKKLYERVKTCLHQQTDLTFDLLVHWCPPNDQICPSSIKLYFEKRKFCSTLVPVDKCYRLIENFRHPVITSQQVEPTSSPDYQDVFEWLGCVACDINLDSTSSESYLSTLSCPTPHHISTVGCYYQLKGFFTSSDIALLLNLIRTSITDYPDCPWICLTVYGFCDSPVSGGSLEHGYCQGGENLYSYIIFPDQAYWLFRATDSFDMT
ncbi:hypothetical protein SNE40_008078 [Patella caerulea]|uniref:Uncharacterized protein n=1 Tax=Patella caerulea TaxID=87958 RepID=A0AAN8Q390_PATCE